MDARAMVEEAFDLYEKTLYSLQEDGEKLARTTAKYRRMVGRFKVTKRDELPKTPITVIDSMCDSDPEINAVMEEKLVLEALVEVHRETLYMVKKKLDQGRSWGVDERTADQLSASWGAYSHG